MKCTATAPTGSSTWITLSQNQTPNTTRSPATAPIIMEPKASTESQGAVIATSPARDAFKHIDTSGFLYFTQVKTIHTTVATAGAIVVVTNTEPSCSTEVAAAPLKPYQPSQRMNTPRAPIGRLCPGKALTDVIFPLLSLPNFPIRGPRKAAPIRAQSPPTICMQFEPAKSWKPKSASQPPPQVQCASIG